MTAHKPGECGCDFGPIKPAEDASELLQRVLSAIIAAPGWHVASFAPYSEHGYRGDGYLVSAYRYVGPPAMHELYEIKVLPRG